MSQVAKVKKPQLVGLCNSRIKTNIIGALCFGTVMFALARTLWFNRKKQQYIDFYKTYDPDAHYARMRDADLMQAEDPQ